MTPEDLAPLRAAAKEGRAAWAGVFMERVMGEPRLAPMAPVIIYRTLDLPDDVKEGAVLLGLTLKAAMKDPASLARAGFGGDPLEAADRLFDTILSSKSGVVFAVDEWSEVLGRISTPDGKIHLALPDLLAELARVLIAPVSAIDTQFPFVLSAGERRSFTANTIIRDGAWRKKDAHGALRMSPADAQALGLSTGAMVKLTTRRGSAVVSVEVSESMQRGHLALPNGMGTGPAGIAPNELTSAEDRDSFVGTPWHKAVPARIERV